LVTRHDGEIGGVDVLDQLAVVVEVRVVSYADSVLRYACIEKSAVFCEIVRVLDAQS
jgi:hypothetical protein